MEAHPPRPDRRHRTRPLLHLIDSGSRRQHVAESGRSGDQHPYPGALTILAVLGRTGRHAGITKDLGVPSEYGPTTRRRDRSDATAPVPVPPTMTTPLAARMTWMMCSIQLTPVAGGDLGTLAGLQAPVAASPAAWPSPATSLTVCSSWSANRRATPSGTAAVTADYGCGTTATSSTAEESSSRAVRTPCPTIPVAAGVLAAYSRR